MLKHKKTDNDKTKQQHSPKPAAKNPSRSIQRAARDPRSMTRDDIREVHQRFGNKAATELILTMKQGQQAHHPGESVQLKSATPTEASQPDTSTTLESNPAGGIVQRKEGNTPQDPTASAKTWEDSLNEFVDQAICNIDADLKAGKIPNRKELGESRRFGEWEAGGNHSTSKSTLQGDNSGQDLERMLRDDERSKNQIAKEQVLNQQKKDTSWLRQCVEKGSQSKDQTLRNSCEWIVTKRIKVYALTPTHARVITAGMDPNEYTAYAKRDIYSPLEDYNAYDLTDNKNVVVYPKNWAGKWEEGSIEIPITPETHTTETDVWETIKHEIGHAVNNLKRDNFANLHRAIKAYEEMLKSGKSKLDLMEANQTIHAEALFLKYKLEFISYYNSKEDEDFFEEFEFVAGEQEKILLWIVTMYPDIKEAFNNNNFYLANGTPFGQAVVTYRNPDAEVFNKYNSIRVDDVFKALDAVGKKEKPALTKGLEGEGMKKLMEEIKGMDIAPVKTAVTSLRNNQLLVAINKLEPGEAAYILSEQEAPAWKKKIEAHLAGKAREEVIKALELKAKGGQKEEIPEEQTPRWSPWEWVPTK